MKPCASTETSAVVPDSPAPWSVVTAAWIVLTSWGLALGSLASWSGCTDTWYWLTGLPSTDPVPVGDTPTMAFWSSSR